MVKAKNEADAEPMAADLGPSQLAVTIDPSPVLGGARGDRFVKGLGFKVVQLRVQPSDYTATGINVSGLLKQLGWGKIVAAIGISWATSPTGSPPTWTIKPYILVWDGLNGTLRAWKGAAGPPTEIAAGDIAANDVVRMILVGG